MFAWLEAMYSSASDKYPLNNMRQVFVHGQTPSQIHGASIRPWTNTLSKSWGKDSYCGRIPCRDHGANIRPWTNSTNSTNGFPEYYSSNLFAFVRGVQSWVSTIQWVALTTDVKKNIYITHGPGGICNEGAIQRDRLIDRRLTKAAPAKKDYAASHM